MVDHTPDVHRQIDEILSLTDHALKSVPPNEGVEETGHDKLESCAQTLRNIVQECPKDDLIPQLSAFISQHSFDVFDTDSAARGLIIVRLQHTELVRRAYLLKDTARMSGYNDPEILSIDLTSPHTQNFLGDLDRSLNDVRVLADRLEQQLDAAKKASVRVAIGPLSVPLSSLLDTVRNSTEDAITYLHANSIIQVAHLKDKLHEISLDSNKLMEAVRQKVKEFGQKIFAASINIAKTATMTYLSGLKLIKRAIVRDTDSGNPQYFHDEADSGVVQTSINTENRLSSSETGVSELERIVRNRLQTLFNNKTLKRSIHIKYELQFCKLVQAQGGEFISFTIIRYVKDPAEASYILNQEYQSPLKKDEYAQLSGVSRSYLDYMAEKALNEINGNR